jgi:hypothetical protein
VPRVPAIKNEFLAYNTPPEAKNLAERLVRRRNVVRHDATGDGGEYRGRPGNTGTLGGQRTEPAGALQATVKRPPGEE